MRALWFLRIFLVILPVFLFPLTATDFARFDAAAGEFDLKNHVYYFFEEAGELREAEALDLFQKNRFTRTASARLSLGYTSKAVWIAIPFRGTGDPLVLEITSLIDNIRFVHLDERGKLLKGIDTGRDFPMHTRPVLHHSFVFPVTTVSEAPGFLMLRLKSQGSMLVPLKLLREGDFVKTDHREQFLYGLYFGIMLVMVLYNFFLFSATRDIAYLYYVLYILFFALFQFSIWGFAHEMLFPDHPVPAKYALPVGLHLATLFQLPFARQFFQARAVIPTLYKISFGFSVVTAVSLAAALVIPYRWFIMMGIVTGAGSAILNFIMAVVLYLKKIKTARFFLIAYSVFIGGALLLGLRNFGLLNHSLITSYSVQIGSVLEVVLLSLALADRINVLRDQKAEAQRQAAARERELTARLENERNRIAGEIHDVVGSELTVLMLESEDPKSDKKSLGQRLKFVLESIRDLVFLLNTKAGFAENLESQIALYAQRLGETKKYEIRLNLEKCGSLLGLEKSLNLHRIFSEWMNNTIRHAKPKSVDIRLSAENGRVRLEITHDGAPFTWNGAPNASGLGNIAHRAAKLKANVSSQGTRFLLEIPVGA
ncbi:MAG: hypothetical protein KF713_20150 [Turneriella sp.]|nr:hypothetical protein [Turneriella sp.]